jgi:protein-arginine kinase activator protein McsA
MMCEKCNKREATISYTTPDRPADLPMLQICEPCLEQIAPNALDKIKEAEAGAKPVEGWTHYNPLSN